MSKFSHHLPITTRVIIATIFVIGLLAGCSRGKQVQSEISKSAGDLTVSFTTDPWPPHSGDDSAVVTVTDLKGQPVNDASVVATANLKAPRQVGSPASGRFQGGGRYSVPLRLIATTYDVDVHIERQGKPAIDVSFPLEAWQ